MLKTLSGEGGLGFTLVPWQPVLNSRIGQHIAGVIATAAASTGASAGSADYRAKGSVEEPLGGVLRSVLARPGVTPSTSLVRGFGLSPVPPRV
jgi:hypothetical protein